MKAVSLVADDFIEEAKWSPRFLPERNGHGLAEAVQLQATSRDSIHYGCIVNHLKFDTALICAQCHIAVCSCSVNLKSICKNLF